MSIKVMSLVMDHSAATGSDRLVLLAIADQANDAGHDAWPSLATIAGKARVSRRTVIRCIDSLVALGELRRLHAQGCQGRGGRTNAYQVVTESHLFEPPSGDTGGTSDSLALGTSATEVVTSVHRSGDTGGTRPVLTHPTHPKRAASTDALDAEFAEFWKIYPRKLDRLKALRAYRTARKIATAAEILTGCERYAAQCASKGTEPQFIKHPTSFLNAGSWENQPMTPQQPRADDVLNIRTGAIS